MIEMIKQMLHHLLYFMMISIIICMNKEEVRSTTCIIDSSIIDSSTLICNIVNHTTTHELNLLINNYNTSSQPVDHLKVKCYNESILTWTSSKFLSSFLSFKLEECKCKTNQKEIVLSGQRLQSVEFTLINPEFFTYMNFSTSLKLETLAIERCALTAIPNSVIAMDRSGIQKLNLRSNEIREIDCRLFQGLLGVEKKRSISLADNAIEEIPSCICQPTTIFYNINLNTNKITDLSNLICLKQIHVDVQDNLLEELPNFSFDGTFTYDFTHNRIKKIHRETFAKAKVCSTLSLGYNEINWIEESAFQAMERLQFLNMAGNHLKVFEAVHAPQNSLFKVNLDIENNKLIHVPYGQNNYNLPQLVSTKAARNPYQCDCFMLEFTRRYQTDREQEKLHPAPPSDVLTKSYKYITAIYTDAWNYICDTPELLKHKHIVQLNTSSTCQILDSCPYQCICTKPTLFSEITSVNCSSQSLTDLPLNMPSGSLILDLSNNTIDLLDARDYLIRTIGLNISYNEVSKVVSGAVTLMQNVTFLDLRFNKLLTIPRSFEDTLFDNMTSIFLSGNMFKCSCENIWMKEWLKTNTYLVVNGWSLPCTDDSNNIHNIVELKTEELQCNPTQANYIIILITLGSLILVLLIFSFIVFKYRYEIRVLFYTRVKTHFISHPSQKTYDAFISYSEHDRTFVTDLVNKLELGANMPYKICIHDRDFQVGCLIVENISSAINNSHVVIFVVSNQFIDSEWCTFEFETAYQTMLQENNKKIVILKLNDVDEEKLVPNLKAYFRTKCYIDADDRLFFDKLVYALPHHEAKPIDDTWTILETM